MQAQMSSEVLLPRESGKFIADHARFVSINKSGVENLGNKIISEITSGKLSAKKFSPIAIHPKAKDPWAIDWYFVVDTLNFCFWTRHEHSWTVARQHGYFALCAAINRAQKENIDILNPSFYSTITREQLQSVLRSDNYVEIPLIEERMKSLHQVGKVLLDMFDGRFVNVVKKADKSATKLLELIVHHFECFRDEASFMEQKVSLYKRAQILIADLWTCFEGEGIGEFDDIEEITMFADYRVPQSLLDFGVFVYDQELLDQLKSDENLPNGDPMEVEIRGCSIHAIELIKKYVNEKLASVGMKTNAIVIDYFLWDYRRKHAKKIYKKDLPFHKTCCIYY